MLIPDLCPHSELRWYCGVCARETAERLTNQARYTNATTNSNGLVWSTLFPPEETR